MCGRYALGQGEEHLVTLFDVDQVIDRGFSGSWNIAPSHGVPVIMERYEVPDAPRPSQRGEVHRQLRCLEWGLIAHWSRDDSHPMINARAETITEKPTFRSAARKRRCLVPATGYYEWQPCPQGKEPWFFSAGPDDPVMAFAGVYEAWRSGPDQPWRRTVAILTRPAADAHGHIHDRSPLIVPASRFADWLAPDPLEGADVRRLIVSLPEPRLTPRRVSRAVGSVANNSPDLVTGIEP
ncbi:SOS response-associated peptidase [Nanchangia anserum]|uniref:Abasic site processing protein n=1 Tax=Nanchangia anserum TaxID=2692125 RepID=A0A8I0KW23_9ACTO|nr:SOS response-associated peptidase [Nanchangia anserum]MBD3689559.1 SOS response-associated peptidase [Nanchangia anserum]QOX81745.1 SOS response-associated peptidase [Nanchangia anserum]